jgi:outer membrane autotransporter protein
MMKKNPKLKYIAMTSVSLFSLAAAFVATFAWFTVARNVDTDGTGFEVTAYDGLIENISLYKQSDYEDDTATYTYNPESLYSIDVDSKGSLTYSKKPTSDDEKLLDAYDGYFYETPISVLVLIKVNTAVAKSHTSGIKITPTSNKTSTQLEDNAKKLKTSNNSLSNILQFSYVNVSSLKTSFTSDDFVKSDESRKLEYFMSTSESSSGTTASYTQTLDGNTYGYDSYKDQSDEYFYIGCIFEYSQTNIEYIYSINIANDDINNVGFGTYLTYTQDFYFRIA